MATHSKTHNFVMRKRRLARRRREADLQKARLAAKDAPAPAAGSAKKKRTSGAPAAKGAPAATAEGRESGG